MCIRPDRYEPAITRILRTLEAVKGDRCAHRFSNIRWEPRGGYSSSLGARDGFRKERHLRLAL